MPVLARQLTVSDFVRQRSVTEIVDAAFQLYRRAPLEYMTAAAMMYVPYLVLRLVWSADLAAFGQTLEVGPEETVAIATEGLSLVRGLFVLLVGVLSLTAMEAPLSWLTSEHYLGRAATALEAVRATVRRIPALVIASTIRFVTIFVGYLFLIVPGIWLHAALFGVAQIMIVERQPMGRSFDRSASLSKGNKLRILGTLLLATIIWLVLLIGLTIVLSWTSSTLIAEIGSALLSVVAYPIVPIAKTVLYYDIRIRREGFDVEWMTGGAA